MSGPLKLRVRSLLYGDCDKTDIYSLDQLKDQFTSLSDTLVIVEGRVVNTYDELNQLLAQGQYKDKELIEVMLLPVLEGG